MPANVRRLVEVGMVPALAKEVAAVINAGSVSSMAVRRLTEAGMIPRHIRELRNQLTTPALRAAKRWTELGVAPRLAVELVAQIVGSGPVAYLGQVATRTGIAAQMVGTLTGAQTRTGHFMRKTGGSTGPQIEVAGFYMNGAPSVETPLTGPTTVKGSIEYPSGTFTALTWSGAASGSVPAGGRLRSDKPTITIPKNAQFWVRLNLFNSSGLPLSTTTPYQTGDGYEAAFSGAAATDKTTSGTVAQTGGNMLLPFAILETTIDSSVLLIGNSRVAGIGDTGDASGDYGELARSIGPTLAYINLGVSGDRADWWIANHANRLGAGAYCSHIATNFGINEVFSGTYTGAQTAALLTQVAAFFPGKPFYAATVAPSTTGAWTNPDGSDQALSPTNPQRVGLNNLIRAGVSGVTGYFENADVVEIARDNGKWKAPGKTADGLHHTQAAYLDIKNAGAINPAVFVR